MPLVAPNTDPIVVPTSIPKQGGIWASLGGLLGVVVDLIPTIPIPDVWRPWVPFIGGVLGYLAHALSGVAPQYHPAPPPKQAPIPDDLDARIAAAVQAALKAASEAPPPTPAP